MQTAALFVILTVTPFLVHAETATTDSTEGSAPDMPPPSNEISAPSPPSPPPIRSELLANRILAAQLTASEQDDSEIVWLGEGDDTYLGLFLPDYSGNIIGSALILHDNQQHPDWPGLVHTLRTSLPANGWSTLSISMPYFDLSAPLPEREIPPPHTETEAPLPSNEDPGETSDDTSPETAAPINLMESASAAIDQSMGNSEASPLSDSLEYTRDQVPSIVDQRIREGISHLQGRNPQPVIVIAIGLSASWAANKAKTMRVKDIRGLVIVDPSQPPYLEGFHIGLDTADLKIPVLDIAPADDQRSQAYKRIRIAKQARHPWFQQRVITGSSGNLSSFEHHVVMTIRGWGNRNFLPK